MVLVQLHSKGESRWLPYEKLIRIRDASMYERAEALKRQRRAVPAEVLLTPSNPGTRSGALDRLVALTAPAIWYIESTSDSRIGSSPTTRQDHRSLLAMKRRRQAAGRPAGVVRQCKTKCMFNEDRIGVFNISQPSHWSSFDGLASRASQRDIRRIRSGMSSTRPISEQDREPSHNATSWQRDFKRRPIR